MVMCFAPTCKHYNDKQGCSFFVFPREKTEFLLWKSLVGRLDKDPTHTSRICSCHFLNGNKRNRPTLFSRSEEKRRKPLFRECCIEGCPNNERDTPRIKFYRFPGKRLKAREKWIAAIGRVTRDGSPWEPSWNSRICSKHFENGKKSDDPRKIGYIPTIFPNRKSTISEPNDNEDIRQFLTEHSPVEENEMKIKNQTYISAEEKLNTIKKMENVDDIIFERVCNIPAYENEVYHLIDELEDNSECIILDDDDVEGKTEDEENYIFRSLNQTGKNRDKTRNFHKPTLECSKTEKTTHKKYRCQYCLFSTDSKSYHWSHFEEHLNSIDRIAIEHSYCLIEEIEDISSPQLIYKCNECDFESTHKNSIKSHGASEHALRGKRTKDEFNCNYCGYKTCVKYAMDHHIAKHKRNVFKCNNCNRMFNSRDVMEKHRASKHQKAMRKCNFCNFFTLYTFTLKGHVQRCHPEFLGNTK